MRPHSVLAAVALTTFIGTQVVALSPALAWGGGPGAVAPAYVQLPPQLSPWPQVPQVPIFGGQNTFGQAPQSSASPQSPQAPGEGTAPTSNSSGQIERSP